MNNQHELIKRIDSLLALRVENIPTATINNDCPLDPDVEKALRDCRAEIERLETALDIASLVRKDHQKRIAELEKPYVPMTNRDLNALDYTGSNIAETVQKAVIARYNEQRGVK